MCQVHTGAYVSLLAPEKIDYIACHPRKPEKTDYTACHPRKTTTYTLHVVSITAHTHDARKSIGDKQKKINRR